MTRHFVLLAAGIIAVTGVFAQKLSDPARTIYKCTINGKVIYSDDPCPGAERLEVQPTRGMNRSTGKDLIGDDVRRERHNEMMADALRPLFNENAKERETRHRRFKMKPEAKAECDRLDRVLPAPEADEVSASAQERAKVQENLLRFRKRYRELNC